MSIIFDLVLLVFLVIFSWRGYKKGLVPGIAGIILMLLAFFAGNLLANTYSSEFTSMIKPFVEGYTDEVLNDAAKTVVSEELQIYSIEDIISLDPDIVPELSTQAFIGMGIYRSSAERLSLRVHEYMDGSEGTLADAMTTVASSVLAYLLVMVIAVTLILIIFTVLANVFSLSFKLPGIEKIDNITGGALGFFRALMIVFFISLLIGYLGMLLPSQTIEKTILLEFFVSKNPLAAILGL